MEGAPKLSKKYRIVTASQLTPAEHTCSIDLITVVVLNAWAIGGVSRGQEWYVKAMKPHFHWALAHSSSVGIDKMQLKPKDAGKNGLSVYFLQVFTIWQEKTNFVLCHRGSGQIKNDVCLPCCSAGPDLTAQRSPPPPPSLFLIYMRVTGGRQDLKKRERRSAKGGSDVSYGAT